MAIKINPDHEGLLRKSTGTKEGENIPLGELMRAKRSKNPKTRRRAVFALNARNWNHK